ncbi:MAG: hypothetical protein Q9204_007136, partial [Flavoplaca sp. TL-2023a]
MPQLELDQQPACKQRKHPQEDNQHKPRYQADDSQRRRQRQHPVADNLRDHQHSDERPRQGLVLDLSEHHKVNRGAWNQESCAAYLMILLPSKDIRIV